ncbi:protein kinase [Streptacidiphilus sp. EB129]|uniref:serine/threonine-protein kinase n=1 Tax=Streptacidiphilus sp. EB129 TaxID=3156262 RepID=UPI003516B914
MRTDYVDLPGYEVVGILGQGGFATVYRARQLAVGREVALKIDSRVLSSARDRQRFMREVTAAGQLSGHPHVVALYDAGVLVDGRPYMVLELCPGGSLGDRLRRFGPFPAQEAWDIGVRIADALAAAHAAGVLHRDIKPGNILVNQYGGVALADFGLAAMPRPGHDLSVTREALTPAYAPPEAFRLAEPTPAGDVYSLAATVYALVLGRPPHHPPEGSLSLAEIITRHGTPIPDLPGVSTALTDVLRQAMAPDPTHRLPSAEALRDSLAAVSLHPAAAPADSPRDVPPPPPPTMTSLPAPRAGSGVQTQPVDAEGPAGTRRRPRWAVPILALAGAVLCAATVLVSENLRSSTGAAAPSPGGASAQSPGASADAGFNVPTTIQNCPAASVAGLNARCTTTAECWGGMVSIAGDVTVNRSDCLVDHPWETFAIAPLPADGMTMNQHELENHPSVRKLCSLDVMAKSRLGKALSIPPAQWTVDVLPPSQTEWASGLRVFRCVATVTGSDATTSYFRPR